MSIIEVKNRIKAVKNIGQITKAMEVVAATKMRKSQQVALNSRPYAFKALQLLSVLGHYAPVKTVLMKKRHVKNTLLVIVTSDRGLAGSFNSQVFRLADKFIDAHKNDLKGLRVLAVGKKAISYANKKRLELADSYSGFGDFIEPGETAHLSDKIISGFLSKDWDRVMTISTHFRSTLKQEVLMRQVLPLDLEKIQKTISEIIPETGRFSDFHKSKINIQNSSFVDYIFEPSPKELIASLVDHLVRMQVYHLVLEANASEHSARMVAMRTASDNAKELSGSLNLEYNKARQAGITKELIEITSAVNTLQ
jgi:F-type H+-transporting ATPase subunit gamma